MRCRKHIAHLTLSLGLDAVLLLLLFTSLWAASTLSLTRITTGASERDSHIPSINSDGSKIAFRSDADFLGQGIPDNQNEIWLYDTTTMTVTRITTGASNRDSSNPSINSDGSKIAFYSDVDLLGQGIPDNQNEIWLASFPYKIFLPTILKAG